MAAATPPPSLSPQPIPLDQWQCSALFEHNSPARRVS